MIPTVDLTQAFIKFANQLPGAARFSALSPHVVCKSTSDSDFHGYIDGLAHRAFARGENIVIIAERLVNELVAGGDEAYDAAKCLGLLPDPQ